MSVKNFTKQTTVNTVCHSTHFLLVANVVGQPPGQLCTNLRYKEALYKSTRISSIVYFCHQLTASLFAYILTLWDAHMENTAKYIQGQGHADLLVSFDQSILALKGQWR